MLTVKGGLSAPPPRLTRLPHDQEASLMIKREQDSLDKFREPLKGSVAVSRTVNLGDFNSRKVELSEEFWLDVSTHEEQYAKLQTKLDKLTGGSEK